MNKSETDGMNTVQKEQTGEQTPETTEATSGTVTLTGNKDNWQHRAENMLCKGCMYYHGKGRPAVKLGRCRRHAPTMSGWPVMFESDWCGDHKIDENKV